jgi:hypothetical protein
LDYDPSSGRLGCVEGMAFGKLERVCSGVLKLDEDQDVRFESIFNRLRSRENSPTLSGPHRHGLLA